MAAGGDGRGDVEEGMARGRRSGGGSRPAVLFSPRWAGCRLRPERYPRLHRLPKTRMPGGGPPDLDGVEPLHELNEVHEAKIDVGGKSGEAASVSRG